MDRVRCRPRLFGSQRRGSTVRQTGGLGVLAFGALLCSAAPAVPAGAVPVASHTQRVQPGAAVGSATADPPALRLLSQTPWVTPGPSTFDLHLQVSAPGRMPAQLGLTVGVYPCLSSVSGFDQSVGGSGPPGAPLSSSHQPIPIQSLPPAGPAAVDLSMPVVVGGSPVPGAPFTIDLVPTAGQCQAFPAGVFPVRIQLVDLAGGSVLGTIATHLVYAEQAPATERLRVALVVPVQLPLRPAPATAAQLAERPGAALTAPSAGALASVAGVVSAVANHPAVAVTLSVGGQTLLALSAAGRQTTIDQLSGLAVDAADHQLLYAPFVPVDATSLVDAGIADELQLQVSRGAAVAAPVTHQQPAPQSPAGLGAWVAAGGLDADTVAALSALGYRQVVVPPSAVVQAPTNGSSAVPFTMSGSHGSELTAVAADPDLSSRFGAAAADPVLAAHQVVAELSQVYYEQPNADVARGVVVVPPNGWSASAAFVDTLLGALAGNPLLEPVSVGALLASVPAAPSCRLDCRLAPGSSAPFPAAGAVRTQRGRVEAFASAAPGSAGRTLATEISDLVLTGQSALLRPTEQASTEAAAGRAVDAQLARVSVAGGQVTLTSREGTLPVTVVSAAPYVVTATLQLSSDKLVFPDGTGQWTRPGVVTLLPAPHTNVIDVPVRSRGSGLFPVQVTLWSPAGRLVVSSGSIDVRSTAASLVGVVLSAGAVAVLAVWWIRTSRRRRTARHRAEQAEPRVPAGVP